MFLLFIVHLNTSNDSSPFISEDVMSILLDGEKIEFQFRGKQNSRKIWYSMKKDAACNSFCVLF